MSEYKMLHIVRTRDFLFHGADTNDWATGACAIVEIALFSSQRWYSTYEKS